MPRRASHEPSSRLDERVAGLLDRLQDGGFSGRDRLRLNELLHAGTEPQDFFIIYTQIDSGLTWDGRLPGDGGHPAGDDGAGIEDVSETTATGEKGATYEGAASEYAAADGKSPVPTVSGTFAPPIRHPSFIIHPASFFGSIPLAYVTIGLVFGMLLACTWSVADHTRQAAKGALRQQPPRLLSRRLRLSPGSRRCPSVVGRSGHAPGISGTWCG